MNTRTWMVMLSLAAGAACSAGVALGQPEGGSAGAPRQSDSTAGAPRSFRDRLEMRRDQLRRMQERLDQAIKRLEAGESEEQLREEYSELLRGRPGGGGPESLDGFDAPPGQMPPGGGRRPGMRGEGPDGGPPEGPGPERFERGGPGRDRWREGGGPDRAPTDEERAAIRAFLRESQPRLFEMLERLEQEDPAEAQRKLAEAFPRLRPLLELRKADPQMFELRMNDLRHGREAMDAARWLAEHGADGGDEVAKHRETLRTALLAQFDARTEIQRREIARQQDHLEQGKADLESRAASRESAVEGMMSRMIEREQERLRRGDAEHDMPHGHPPGEEPGRRGGPGRRGDR